MTELNVNAVSVEWDCEIDAPATVLVVGGGLAGVEAALYARFLGYSVLLVEKGRIASGLIQGASGDSLNGTFESDIVCSSVGLAALEAQGVELPKFGKEATIADFVEEYLTPVAKSDLLYDCIQVHSELLSVSRLGCTPAAAVSNSLRSELEFRVLIASKRRGEYSQLVDIVVDCSGMSAERIGLAAGGGLAVGETSLAGSAGNLLHPQTGIPDDLPDSSHLVMWGAASEVSPLWESLHEKLDSSQIRVTWIESKRAYANATSSQDSKSLIESMEQWGASAVHLSAWGIEEISWDHEKAAWELRLQTGEEETLEISGSHFVNCSQRLPCNAHLAALPAARMRPTKENRLPTLTAEPHYYSIGSRLAAGQEPTLAEIRTQIRDTFALIGGRPDLDLYETVKPQKAP